MGIIYINCLRATSAQTAGRSGPLACIFPPLLATALSAALPRVGGLLSDATLSHDYRVIIHPPQPRPRAALLRLTLTDIPALSARAPQHRVYTRADTSVKLPIPSHQPRSRWHSAHASGGCFCWFLRCPACSVISETHAAHACLRVSATFSIVQGNCTTPPPPRATLGLEGPDLQWQPPQCVIVTDHTSFYFYGKIWLDNLYIRAKPSAYFYFMFLVAQQGSEVYGSGVTLQGDGNYNTTAVWTEEGARVYIEGMLLRSCSPTSLWRRP